MARIALFADNRFQRLLPGGFTEMARNGVHSGVRNGISIAGILKASA
ncbi:hypothetical protein [Herminiimonas sp. CN]|nr:hypothetical protein [Herminiimonas sp. CN]